MNKRRERTLRDLCDATPSLSQPQVTPILKGNFRMQGPVDEANCNLLTHMVTPENSKGSSSCSDRSQKVDYGGRPGTCNVCSAPCSSCFHVNKVLMNSNDGSGGEICAENIEIGQPSLQSIVAGMNHTSDSFSENAVGKASSRTFDASGSDDSMVLPKSEDRRGPEGHDDCLSCVSGNEHANRKSDDEDSKINYNKKSKKSGENFDKVLPSTSLTGFEIPFSKSTNDATDLLNIHNTCPQASNGKYLSHDGNPRGVKSDTSPDTKDKLLEGSIEHLDSLSPRDVKSNVGDSPATALISIAKNDGMEVETHPVDESDDSDMVEQDVKVCDICGDAGREDYLAICCRCSDGAEHTYCMREMLAKVPEGEWLCEECKSVERVGNGRQEKIGRIDENEKNNSSGQASSEYVNSSDVEGRRNKSSMRNSYKRNRDDDDIEVSSGGKKPSLESIVGSPKTSDSSKTAALSRESSLKNLEKGKAHHSSLDTVPVNYTTESASSASDPRVHNFRGHFSKSNSFNSLSSKPKVKLVDQVVIQRQKSAKEHGSFRLKEGTARSIGKSMSFKSTNSSRSESKIKMLSPRPSNIQDLKNAKHRSLFERQRSFKAEHSSINLTGASISSTPRMDKRSASRGESTISNHHEVKPVKNDGKSAVLSRSSSLAARKTAELSSSLGEFKSQQIYGHCTLGVSSANGVNNIEQKCNKTSVKQDFSCSVAVERPPLDADEGLPDGLPRPRDLTNSGERMREYPGSRFGPPSVKSSRDESDNLKAAIEAAVLRKPGVYRRHKAFGQSEDSYVSSMGRDVASLQDNISSSARKKKNSSDAELPEKPSVSRSLTADCLKQETLNNMKQSSLVPLEGPSGGQDGAQIGPFPRDVSSNVSAATPFFLKSLPIPEHEYIWQGSFDICRSGKTFDSWDGIQAHLSTCASPKVIEAANKFKSRIVLYEVPRASTWPVQFQEHGVKEDNIGLFFFAKDLESYDKIYKLLLDNMMKHDLALKGNLNGIELLIFPSNQLPDNSQRWNMLFFLWGVFRGKKESSLQHMPESLNQFCAPRDIPPPIISLSENRCSLRPINEDLHMREDATPVPEMPASEQLRRLLSSRVVNGDCGSNISSLDKLDHRLNCSSSPAVQSDSAKGCQEMRRSSQEGGISSSCSTPLVTRSSSCSGRGPILMQLDTAVDGQQSSHSSSKSLTGTLKETVGEGTMLDMTCNQNQVKLIMDAGDLTTDGEKTPLEDDQSTRDLNMKHSSKWFFNNKEYMHPGSTPDSGTGQVSLRNDSKHNETSGAHEKMNDDVPSSSYALENRHHEAFVETPIPESVENAERHFFPVESQPSPLVHGPMPWKTHLVEREHFTEKVPDLELALGAERKPPMLSIRPLLVNEVDQQVNGEHILEEVGTKAEDDVSASLSLSLAFPFPEKELSTKPAPKAEQLVSDQRERVSTSMLLFGKLRDN